MGCKIFCPHFIPAKYVLYQLFSLNGFVEKCKNRKKRNFEIKMYFLPAYWVLCKIPIIRYWWSWREGNIILARSGVRVTVLAGKSLVGRESFIDMFVSSGLPLVENERTGTDTANYLVLLQNFAPLRD